MQFPDDLRTRATERVMKAWKEKNPNCTTSEYNREFTGVYERFKSLHGLNRVCENDAVDLKFKEPDLDLDELIGGVQNKIKPPPFFKTKRKPTKGAFGKCKKH